MARSAILLCAVALASCSQPGAGVPPAIAAVLTAAGAKPAHAYDKLVAEQGPPLGEPPPLPPGYIAVNDRSVVRLFDSAAIMWEPSAQGVRLMEQYGHDGRYQRTTTSDGAPLVQSGRWFAFKERICIEIDAATICRRLVRDAAGTPYLVSVEAYKGAEQQVSFHAPTPVPVMRFSGDLTPSDEPPPPLRQAEARFMGEANEQALRRVYPASAAAQGVEGRALIRCAVDREPEMRHGIRVGPGGRVRDCVVASETPAGEGFGAAAFELAAHYRVMNLDEWKQDSVTIPIVFRRDYKPVEEQPLSIQYRCGPGWIDERDFLAAPPPQAFTAAARQAGVAEGAQAQVTLECGVTTGHRLERCTVTRLQPVTAEVGRAALSLTRDMHVRQGHRDCGRLEGTLVLVKMTLAN